MPTPVVAEPRKTIVFVSNNAWSVYNFRLDVIKWMLSSGYKVVVLSPPDDYAEKLVQQGCRFIAIDFNNKGENPVKDLRFYLRLRSLYRSIAPDFIFHYVAKPNIYGSLAAGARNIPSVAVITGLGYPFAKRNWLFRIIKLLYRRALKNAREVWFLNNEDARVFVKEKIVSIVKMKVLAGEGVNTEHFAPGHDRAAGAGRPFQFIMSTRLLKSKGVSLYADAARILRRKHYPAVFNLIGFFEAGHPDSIDPALLEAWKNEGLIHYFGFADDVRPYLAQADCLVFPSYYNEGVPRCLMEAASMEIPVVTSLNRGCKEVVHDQVNGYLCNLNDAFDLADKMEKMLNLPPEERCAMGKKGRALVIEKFDIRKIIAEYANTLISVFESPGDLHPAPEKTKNSG